MKLSLKHLKLNEYTNNDDEVPEGTRYGFWRVVEHTDAGWFPWPALYSTEESAQKHLNRMDTRE